LEIKQNDNGQKGSFYFASDSSKEAEMTYTWAGTDRIIIDHTEVGDNHRGEGLGEQLVKRAVDFAREKGIAIIPLCPFARSVFDKNQELRDVL